MQPLELVRSRLEDAGCNPRGPEHKLTALCPAHEDRSPSLSCSEGDDGRALVHCWAGCTVNEVCAALDLEIKDLFAESTSDDWKRRRPLKRRKKKPPVMDTVHLILDAWDAAGLYFQPDQRFGYWRAECPLCTTWLSVWIFDPTVDEGREEETPFVFCANGCDSRRMTEGVMQLAREGVHE